VNESIEEFLVENGSKNKLALFYCECSRPNCIERINLSPNEYGKIHKDKKRFVILSGHEFPEVEKVIKKTSHYQVVEKYFKPPKAKDIEPALKNISVRV